jgi:glucose/arabinose dehydrogenase
LLTAHHISVSPDGGTVVFTDRGDRLLSMEIASGAVDTLSTDHRYYAPIFTSGGEIISPSLDGGIIHYQEGETIPIDQGEHPVWWREREALIYVKTTDDGHRITSSDIWMWTEEGGSERLGETPDIIEVNPAPSARGVLYVDLATGRAGFRGVPR